MNRPSTSTGLCLHTCGVLFINDMAVDPVVLFSNDMAVDPVVCYLAMIWL